jgi:hypothetical protein
MYLENMKMTNKYLMFAGVALALASCDLDKLPEGQYVGGEQNEDIIEQRPNMVIAGVNAMSAQLNVFGTISDDANTYHNDYGIAAVFQFYDQSCQDMPCTTSGYNWFNRSQNYSDRLYDSSEGELIWKTYYNHLKAANDVIALTEGTDDPTMLVYRGQALAARAFDYLNLAQTYQFTYVGHENDLCVPIITEGMTEEEMQTNPRATVAQVYELIMSDLNQAVELLAGNDNGTNKDKIDEAVAYGLRARANLLMQKWADAAKDAEKALAGGTPYSLAEVSKPAFNSASADSWLWGVMITPDNDVVTTGIINWPSHLCSLTGNGYTTLTGAWRYVSSALYNQIPDTDIRKQWFISPDTTSTLVDNASVGGESVIDYFGLTPYANVKFGAYQDVMGNTTNSQDWPLMRVEEMYYIKAEGEAMSGNVSAAKRTLEDFVKTYRNPSYSCTASSAQDLQDEIWLQRRMEFWGEGFSLFDVLRLKKPIVRKNTNYAAIVQYNIEPESQILIYRIPQCEMETNKGIADKDNNPAAPQPTV